MTQTPAYNGRDMKMRDISLVYFLEVEESKTGPKYLLPASLYTADHSALPTFHELCRLHVIFHTYDNRKFRNMRKSALQIAEICE